MTIGVIDECRSLGLGSKLLDATYEIIKERWPQCRILYLHVVDYNNVALKFYNKNGFKFHKKILDHYTIFD